MLSQTPANTCTSLAAPTLKPSYSQVTRLGIRAHDPRRQHMIGACVVETHYFMTSSGQRRGLEGEGN